MEEGDVPPRKLGVGPLPGELGEAPPQKKKKLGEQEERADTPSSP